VPRRPGRLRGRSERALKRRLWRPSALLADVIGTTRSRVSYFMNGFRQAGFIDYNGHLKIHSSLLSVVLAAPPRSVDLDDQPRC
jgi:hypothetical protein